jgi:hypothetical protein
MRFPPEFSPDLVARVRGSVEKSGYFMFGRDEMNLLCITSNYWAANRRELLEKFAAFCGVEVESGNRFKCARFHRREPMNPPLVPCASPVVAEEMRQL